jgi:superfamily II DNA or RNA helicase
MIILHTCWHGCGLCAWGEADSVGEAVPLARATETNDVSPFDPGGEALCETLARVMRGVEAPPAEAFALRLDFPTRLTAQGPLPLPSQPFLCSEEMLARASDATRVERRAWRVSALRLPWRAAFTLLGLCKDRRLGPEVFAGEDLLGYAELFHYAGAMVARGRFLPDLRRSADDRYEARWRPCVDREEAGRVSRLTARLPGCAASGQAIAAAAEDFLDETVDRLVRVSVMTTLSRAQAERGKHYSAHDAWFSALRGDERGVRWDAADELGALADQLEGWRRPVEGGCSRDEQVALHLHEPDDPAQPWRLRATFPLPAGPSSPTEGMLLSLGQAILLFPPLGGAEPGPDGPVCLLSALEAHAFLTSSSALLSAAGFKVDLPAWWKPDNLQALTLEAEASPHTASDDMPDNALAERVDVRWSVLLNGAPVSPEELVALLRSDSPLVYFRGQWIHLDVRQLQNALRVGRGHAVDSHSALEVVRLALGTGGGHGGLSVSAVRSAGWLDPFLKRLCGEQTFETLPPPTGFHGELRPYQQRGFSWLVRLREWGFGACLADDMGLGKTIQALAFLLHQREVGEKRPALLVGPMSVLGNWLKEAGRFAPGLRCLLHHGAQRAHGDTFAREVAEHDVVITSYNLLYRDYTDLRKVPWSGVLLDEAQNIKNPDTQQAQAARALQADYRIALTGTPMENHVGDVWSLMDFLNPGMLGRRTAFRDTFFRPIQTGTEPGARARLRRVTTPFILRRLKTDKQIIADLPEKVEGKVYCPLTVEQARLYEEVLEAFHRDLEGLDGVARRGRILAVLTRLKQVCNHPAHYLGEAQASAVRSGKLTRLEEMLEEVFARGESALVFTQYAAMGTLLKRRLCHAFASDMPFLHGGVPRKERDRLVQAYQASTQPLAFILSLKAGGTGLNLTRATHVFHYDRWWNPAVENQATDRAFRIGQTHNVMVHKFLCGGTLEERIDAMIESKTALADEIVSSGESFLTELSNTELHDVLRLDAAQGYWNDGMVEG